MIINNGWYLLVKITYAKLRSAKADVVRSFVFWDWSMWTNGGI